MKIEYDDKSTQNINENLNVCEDIETSKKQINI